jgi:flagellar protein FliT
MQSAMSASQVIAHYESLSALSEQMRGAALRGEWDPLVEIERERSRLVADLKPLDAGAKLDDAAHRRKEELITGILACDAEVRTAVEAWMAQFQLGMQSSIQELRLLKEYGL